MATNPNPSWIDGIITNLHFFTIFAKNLTNLLILEKKTLFHGKILLKEGMIMMNEKEREKKILEMFEKMPEKSRTPIEKEFDKYAKLYEERFNKRAYIPVPSGTIEFAIECIKKCLSENKDMLDELYYPNFEKDMEDDVLY